MDAFENRCVVVADIPAAFLSANWPKNAPDCHIRFKGPMMEMLLQIKPEYRKLIQNTKMKNGPTREVLVGEISKNIY